jgi:acetamidase/formamidase
MEIGLGTFHLPAGPETCHWGYFDSVVKPALRVKSGDTVTIESVSGSRPTLPDPEKFDIPPELLTIIEKVRPEGPHILTGPVYVEGAEPGDVLEVRIHAVECRHNWGYNLIRPQAGTLPDDYDETVYNNIPLDLARNVALMPWGLELPLRPFFGVMGVAPPPGWGRITSVVPRAMGGNLDNRELIAGTTLYLPVFNEGALFSCGDGHGAQGDGEVCITAIETGLRGTFEFVVRKDMALKRPLGETPDHWLTMAFDPDLDQCAVTALRDMIALLSKECGLTHAEAYMLCSLAGNLRITQTVNGSKGVHMMMEKVLMVARKEMAA